jgi:hypothetical protein
LADILSATSLLTALLGLLYAVWYPEINTCLAIVPERKRADRDGQIRQVESALHWRALPLAAGALGLCLVLAPEVIRVLAATVSIVLTRPPRAWPRYDAVAAAFAVAYGFLTCLAGLGVSQVVRLQRRSVRLRQPDRPA